MMKLFVKEEVPVEDNGNMSFADIKKSIFSLKDKNKEGQL